MGDKWRRRRRMRTSENMHDERAEYSQHDHVRKQQEKARRACLPGSHDYCCCQKQRNNYQDAQYDSERVPGDAARILRFLIIKRNTRGFMGGQRAEGEDDGDVVDAGADDDTYANTDMTSNDRVRRSRVIGNIGPDCTEQAQYSYREAK